MKKLCIYITVGYPKLNDTISLIKALDTKSVDYIEVGMPYSDPLADGAIIQETSKQALENGITLDVLFEQLRSVGDLANSTLIYMGYFNPLLKYGLEKFLKNAKDANILGCIIHDLPMEVYQSKYKEAFNSAGIGMNFLVSPTTSDERIKMADQLSDQYLYVISQNTITGTPKEVTDAQVNFYKKLANLGLKKEKLIGFGIHDKNTFDFASQYADGAIIGSAYLKAIGKSENVVEASNQFVDKIRLG